MVKTSKNQKSSKLRLNHQTVRLMASSDLAAVAGGANSFGNATGGAHTSGHDCCEK